MISAEFKSSVDYTNLKKSEKDDAIERKNFKIPNEPLSDKIIISYDECIAVINAVSITIKSLGTGEDFDRPLFLIIPIGKTDLVLAILDLVVNDEYVAAMEVLRPFSQFEIFYVCSFTTESERLIVTKGYQKVNLIDRLEYNSSHTVINSTIRYYLFNDLTEFLKKLKTFSYYDSREDMEPDFTDAY